MLPVCGRLFEHDKVIAFPRPCRVDIYDDPPLQTEPAQAAAGSRSTAGHDAMRAMRRLLSGRRGRSRGRTRLLLRRTPSAGTPVKSAQLPADEGDAAESYW